MHVCTLHTLASATFSGVAEEDVRFQECPVPFLGLVFGFRGVGFRVGPMCQTARHRDYGFGLYGLGLELLADFTEYLFKSSRLRYLNKNNIDPHYGILDSVPQEVPRLVFSSRALI